CCETPHGLPAGERYLEGLKGQAQDLSLFVLLAWTVVLRGYLLADTESSGDPGHAGVFCAYRRAFAAPRPAAPFIVFHAVSVTFWPSVTVTVHRRNRKNP